MSTDTKTIKTVTVTGVTMVLPGLFRVFWEDNGPRACLTSREFDGAVVTGQRTLLFFDQVNGNRRIVKAVPSSVQEA